ncbi:ras-related protein Ral-A isoform X1 [Monodelphis domestica]|uniref:ras-related protein Ral-A isoform X1 n=1 Tax=Monodelphis domestica TaxID=13616 RepID=UPI0024E1E215|nr:ras-related protein Ral-A isoform X1 [Monodelphis domestica]
MGGACLRGTGQVFGQHPFSTSLSSCLENGRWQHNHKKENGRLADSGVGRDPEDIGTPKDHLCSHLPGAPSATWGAREKERCQCAWGDRTCLNPKSAPSPASASVVNEHLKSGACRHLARNCVPGGGGGSRAHRPSPPGHHDGRRRLSPAPRKRNSFPPLGFRVRNSLLVNVHRGNQFQRLHSRLPWRKDPTLEWCGAPRDGEGELTAPGLLSAPANPSSEAQNCSDPPGNEQARTRLPLPKAHLIEGSVRISPLVAIPCAEWMLLLWP